MTPPGARRRPPAPATVRLHKALADAGLASRRAAEQWIRDGRVVVNGAPARIGQSVGPRDRVVVDGRLVRLFATTEPPRVLLYKKRVGELVTRSDPDGRRTVFRKLPKLAGGRWIAVGRLDVNTSGLLLLTNHGELARRLMHPSFEIERRYAVRVLGTVDAAVLERLRRPTRLDDGPARFAVVALLDDYADDEPVRADAEPGRLAAPGATPANRWLQVVVREGRNRLVRRLFEAHGLTVSRLIRVGYGPVSLGGGIRSGSFRELAEKEVAALMQAVGLITGDSILNSSN